MAQQIQKTRRISTRLTPEGWVFVVILSFVTISAILRNVNLLIVLAAMMIATILLSWRSQIHILKALVCKRNVPQHIHAGQLINIQWESENCSRQVSAWNLIVNDELNKISTDPDTPHNDKNRTKVAINIPQVGSGQATFTSYKTLFADRGTYDIGNAIVSSSFPFGLIRSQKNVEQTKSLVVAPKLGTLSAVWEQRLQSLAAGSEALKRRKGAEEEEFYALRRWRSGDNRKHIHWRSTAKFGRPMVKQFDQRSNRDLAIVLDLFTPNVQTLMQTEFAEFDSWSSRCEAVLSFVATVFANLNSEVQGQVAFGVCGAKAEVLTDRFHHELVVQIMRSLALAEEGANEELGSIIVEIANCVSQGTPVYVVSSRARPTAISQWGISKSEQARVLPLIRWLDVCSPEFEELFDRQSEADARQLRQLQEKWVADED